MRPPTHMEQRTDSHDALFRTIQSHAARRSLNPVVAPTSPGVRIGALFHVCGWPHQQASQAHSSGAWRWLAFGHLFGICFLLREAMPTCWPPVGGPFMRSIQLVTGLLLQRNTGHIVDRLVSFDAQTAAWLEDSWHWLRRKLRLAER